jgi:hypothetical protein
MQRLIAREDDFERRIFDNQPEELSDVWDAVGQLGSTGIQLLFANSGASAGGPARGSAAINSVGQQAIQSLNQLLQLVQSGRMQPARATSEAQRIAAALSDPQYVYQAQHGSDADALNRFKQQAAGLVQQIQSVTAHATVGSPQTSIPGSGSLLPFLLAGGLALILLKR